MVCAYDGNEAVRAVTRVEAEGDKLARVRNYFYTPDVLAEICAELNMALRSNGYPKEMPSGSTFAGWCAMHP